MYETRQRDADVSTTLGGSGSGATMPRYGSEMSQSLPRSTFAGRGDGPV
jgi:hypothetical protein